MGRNRVRGVKDIRTHGSLRASSSPVAADAPLLGPGAIRIGLGRAAPRAAAARQRSDLPRTWVFFNKPRFLRDQGVFLVDPMAEPEVDVFAEGQVLVVLVELPGIRDEDIDIQIDGDVLTIAAGAAGAPEAPVRARRYYREILLPFPVAGDHIERAFRNGVLELSLAAAGSDHSKRPPSAPHKNAQRRKQP